MADPVGGDHQESKRRDEGTMSTIEKWRKSSRSNAESACVELSLDPARAGIRDSKNRDGGTLALGPAVFQAFLASVKAPRS